MHAIGMTALSTPETEKLVHQRKTNRFLFAVHGQRNTIIDKSEEHIDGRLSCVSFRYYIHRQESRADWKRFPRGGLQSDDQTDYRKKTAKNINS